MSKFVLGNDLYIRGRIGWRGLSKDEYLEKSEYKIINATALMDGYVDWDNCGYISKERYEESDEIMLQENDILISKDGTLGKIGYVKNLTTPCTVASGIFVVRNTIPEILDFDYLYHILKSNIFKDFIRRNKAEGSTINHLYQRDLVNFEIDLPEINMQKKIARVLNDLDNKIENNNKINAELESMAKTIYDYWFLQFEFPNEEGKPYKSSGGKMVWNEELKREIPEGWEVGKTTDLGEIVAGGTPSTKHPEYYTENGIGWITPKDLSETNDKYICHGERDITKIGLQKSSAKLMPKGSVLLSSRAPIGYVAVASAELCTNQGFKSVVPNERYGTEFVYYSIQNMVSYFKSLGTGSTFTEISKRDVENANVILPPKEYVLKFNNISTSLGEKRKNAEEENKELTSLRDFLLPMLMNGQIGFK